MKFDNFKQKGKNKIAKTEYLKETTTKVVTKDIFIKSTKIIHIKSSISLLTLKLMI